MLHVDFMILIAGEGQIKLRQRAIAHVLVELILVEIVLCSLTTTIVQSGLSNLASFISMFFTLLTFLIDKSNSLKRRLTFFSVEISLLNEASEWR